MKYLKSFNEDKKSLVESDLIRIADDCLAYLYDDGYHVWASHQRWGNTEMSTTFINLGKSDGNFKWVDIKDSYITFIEYISEIYDIDKIQITHIDSILFVPGSGGFNNTEYTFYDITNDNIDNDKIITQINLYVKVKNIK